MNPRYLAAFATIGLALPFTSPASAAPACVVLDWRHGDACHFQAPAGTLVFGGTATAQDGDAWIAVEVLFNGIPIASCYGSGHPVAACEGTGQAFVSLVTYECRVSGTGGPKFHCADPPPLPVARI